jgi:hypothetical protein
MTARAPMLPFSLDPVIAEAKRRARKRRFLMTLLVLLLLVGLFSGVLLVHPAGAPRPSGNGLGHGTKLGAAGQVANARRLLNQLVLPAGTQRLRVAPHGDGGLLRHAQSVPGVSQLGDFHRIWRVHKTYASSTSFVENRLPRGARGESRGGRDDRRSWDSVQQRERQLLTADRRTEFRILARHHLRRATRGMDGHPRRCTDRQLSVCASLTAARADRGRRNTRLGQCSGMTPEQR